MSRDQKKAGWEALGLPPGLCRECRFAELLASARSVFLRCGKAATDERFPRFPRLPVSSCRGFEPVPGESEEGARPDADRGC